MHEVLSRQVGQAGTGVTQSIYRHVFDTEREALTFDPVTAAGPPREPRKVRVGVKRLQARIAQATPSAAPAMRLVKSRDGA